MLGLLCLVFPLDVRHGRKKKPVVYNQWKTEDVVVDQVIRDMLVISKNMENPTEIFTVLQDVGLSLHSIFLPPSTSIFNHY